MEDVARSALTGNTIDLVMQYWTQAPVIFAHWAELYETAPELVAIAFAKVIASSRTCRE